MSGNAAGQPVAAWTKRTQAAWLIVCGLLTVWLALHLPAWLPSNNIDQQIFFLPWLDRLVTAGRLRSLDAAFVQYNPPYGYLLSLASLLHGRLAPLIIIKLINAPFLVLAAWLVVRLTARAGLPRRQRLAAAWLLLVAPEIVENGWLWGQCDMVYGSLLLGTVAALLARRPAWAMAAFAVALSFKLQAMFFAPVLLILLLAGEIPAWTLLVSAAAYLLMLLPAMFAGRPLFAALTVYGTQYSMYQQISFDAANPYSVLRHWVHTAAAERLVDHAGMLLALLVNVALVLFLWRLRDRLKNPVGLMTAAALSITAEVYTLPKMHERYYFVANLLLLVLTALRPSRFWIMACLTQLSAVLCYRPYLYGTTTSAWYFLLPLLMTTAAGVLLVRELSGKQQAMLTALPQPAG